MSKVPAAEPVLGTTIDGKYRIDALMGKGGMGKVYRVTHLQLNKTFALKLMNFTPEDSDPNRLARFRREAEALAKITHPNVVMVTDFGITPEQIPYIVMEFIEGVPLRNLLEKMGKLSEKQAILIAKQMCAGLHAAHVQGIIHRDLKPENIMIQQLADEEIMARVLDFGIAKVLQSDDPASQNLTSNEELLGTLKYMTPEQFLGAPVDARSDVFGISLITYEMLTGIVAPAVMSLAQPLHELRPDISPRLSEIVLRGLAQSPEQRQQSALELKRELENLEHDVLLESAMSMSDRSSDGVSLSSNPTNSGRPVNTATNRASTVSTVRRPANSVTPEHSVAAPAFIESTPKKSSGALYAVIVVVVLLLGGGGFAAWKYLIAPPPPPPKVAETAKPGMVLVKAGKFKMGNDPVDEYSKPPFDVTVESFMVSKFMITNRQYAEFVKNTKYTHLPKHWQGDANPPANILEQAVTNITWTDANAYCNWLTRETGKNYRLPTEKEWEYIAKNRSEMSLTVEELVVNLDEWTDSELYLYPNSKSKLPGFNGTRMRIHRGPNDNEGGKPETFRKWHPEDFAADFLGFRVACKASN